MAGTNIKAQEMLEQLLSTGRELATQGRERSKGLTKKSKEIAAKGEDYLVDKLGIEDNEVARNTLRKGVGVGAAAGALALLLSSRSGRKIATLGGLAGVGALAWKAYKDENSSGHAFADKVTQQISGLFKGPEAEKRAEVLIRAMVAAAKADGRINDDEMAMVDAHNKGSSEALKAALSQASNPKTIAALAGSQQEAREIYAVSCRVANGLNAKERDYLDRLAMALELDPELAARIETDVRTG